MPTRAATAKAEAEAGTARVTRSRVAAVAVSENGEKENNHAALASVKPQTKKPSAKSQKAKAKEVFCICKGVDDGRPMVQCGHCNDWIHFECIDLDPDEAADISIYVCPPCSQKTNRHTVMNYDASNDIEPIELKPEPEVKAKPRDKSAASRSTKTPEIKQELRDSTESEGDDGTEDEYVDENAQKAKNGKRTSHAVVVSSSDDDSPSTSKSAPRPRHSSTTQKKMNAPESPTMSNTKSTLARRQSTTSAAELPPKKRARTASNAPSATEDRLRKYALDGFTRLFSKIFQNYPYLRTDGEESEPVEAKWDELTDEQKTDAQTAANAYAVRAEAALLELCGETDKDKYKSSYRTLDFNLSKTDRITLHKRISSGRLPPESLVRMSSDELASEEEQKLKREAEEEALAQSILKKSLAPRAKITHKGLQDIEDVNGEIISQREREDSEDKEDEARARRERERLARLKPVQAPGVQSPTASIPPESPALVSATTPSTSWGAPPPVPTHGLAVDAAASSPTTSRPPAHPLFYHTGSELAVPAEHDINLGDFIHIDDESPVVVDDPVPSSLPTPALELDQPPLPVSSPKDASPQTAMSPFAASKPDMPPRASFDLSSVWTDAKPPERPPTPEPNLDEQKVSKMDVDVVVEQAQSGDDLDFDMFLQKEDEDEPMTAVEEPVVKEQQLSPEVAFESLPHVWEGTISMPTDSITPESTRVFARQIGGKEMESDSPLWRTLCPSDQFRVDGRVPVAHSTKYISDARVASAKDLVAVAFIPESEHALGPMQSISRFLMGKDRHGLVFPWGKRGKEWGSELYIVPLPKGASIPESIELLDNFKLPKLRNEDCFIGVWVLNRGKLQPPPPAPTRAPPPPPSFAPQTLLGSQAIPALSSLSQPTHGYSPPSGVSPFSPPTGSTPIVLPPSVLAAVSSLTGGAKPLIPAPTPAPVTPATQPTSYTNPTAPVSSTAPALAGLSNMSLEELATLPLEQLKSLTQLLQGVTGQTALPQGASPHSPPSQHGPDGFTQRFRGSPPPPPAPFPPQHPGYSDRSYEDERGGSGPSRGGPRGGFRGRSRGRGRYSGGSGGGRGRNNDDFRGGGRDNGWGPRGRGGHWG